MFPATSNGEIWAAFLKMRIPHPRLESVTTVMDDLRTCKRLAPRSPQRFASLFADTQSGKSTAVLNYIEQTVIGELIASGELPEDVDRIKAAEDQRKVLHVTLSDAATPKSLAIDILSKFVDPRAASGTTPDLLRRCYKLMNTFGTELLVVDEVQHLSVSKFRMEDNKQRKTEDTSTSATNTFKVMLERGLVPILFVGVYEARHHLFNDRQLSGRCLMEIDYSRLQWSIEKERKMFVDYLGMIGLKLRIDGICMVQSNFLQGDIPPCVHEVAGGRLGMASNLISAGCCVALELGSPTVERSHLEMATDEWAVPKGIIDYNPFREGVRQARLS